MLIKQSASEKGKTAFGNGGSRHMKDGGRMRNAGSAEQIPPPAMRGKREAGQASENG
jgi:hypothetical protein